MVLMKRRLGISAYYKVRMIVHMRKMWKVFWLRPYILQKTQMDLN